MDGDSIEKPATEIKWDTEAAEKGGFEHFMMKEIHEQPKAVKDTLNSVVPEGKINLSNMGITEEDITSIDQIYSVACGSACHVGVAAHYVVEDMAKIPVRVELAPKFRYRKLLLKENDLVIIISQSGETADSLVALGIAKDMGVKALAIVNVVNSSIARGADYVFYTMEGLGIAVATTRAGGAYLMGLTTYGNYSVEDTAEFCVFVPKQINTLHQVWQ